MLRVLEQGRQPGPQDWKHKNIWCNVPFHLAHAAMSRCLECKAQSPEDTAATFIIPAWSGTPAWDLAEKRFELVEYHPPFSDVFTCTPLQAGEGRRAVGPTRFPVAVITCARGHIRTSQQTVENLRGIPAWRAEDQSAAANSLVLPTNMAEDVKEFYSESYLFIQAA